MYEIKPIDNLLSIMQLWNEEMGNIYPIAKDIFQQNVIDYKEKKVYGAYDGAKLVGFIIGKTFIDPLIPEYQNLGWISLFYVSKKYRKQGIGSQLLSLIEKDLSDKKEINIGRDISNFFPGVPCDFDNLTDEWLLKRGYTGSRYTHDLVNRNCRFYQLKNDKYEFTVCTLAHKEALLAFMKQFGSRWYWEAYDYFAHGGDGKEYVIALDNHKVIAFSRINDRLFSRHTYNITWYLRFSNLGGIGPLGVDSNYRGLNLGYDIVAYGINTLLSRGIKEIIIDWTSILEFYQHFDFEVWKAYKYMSKKG